ncbi:GMC family oxidoreductase [Halovulum dunhuangense]|uniref:GMC family oxidoreductase n=1 Tax=Halovulum dunhuangense TaxID=1505036 RepID=A0A849L208_9RHOB|nr:GMC family oxidoreductase [Halovulum dunhuangense]NNU80305.1 GMC family oxidoreductase [Halovulum dunhuangense]
MIRDANSGVPRLEGDYDCCIVGAGPAGIAIALRLARAGRRVLLLEAGDRDYTHESQSLYDGEVLGLDYDPLDAPRLRHLGGTTGHWGGQCLLFDRFDFAPRADVPLSGWPIGYDDLEPYQRPVADLLGFTPFGAPRRAGRYGDTLDELSQRWAVDRAFHELRSYTPLHFGIRFVGELEAEPGIDLVLNANVTGLDVDGTTGRVTGARVESYSGHRFIATAGRFVLAMGGMEVSRALLHLNEERGNLFGNQGGMVGRCFMEHPVLHNGSYFITRRLYSHSRHWEFERLLRHQKPEVVLSPTETHMRAAGILNGALHLDRMYPREIEAGASTDPFVAGLVQGRDYHFTGTAWVVGEQAPNPDSRIVLTDGRDRFGLRRVGMDWRLLPIDVATLRETSLEVARMFIRTGLGRMQMHEGLWARDAEIAFDYSRHHMGGARMAADARTGVVDADCRVHGAQNLYVAGSAVFATSSHANPTFTILQLAMRLADHLTGQTA